MGQDFVQSSPADIPDASQQARDARHVEGSRLQAVRQKVRHPLLDGLAARSPFQKGPGGDVLPAEQHASALGAIEPLMSRHGDEGGPQGLHVQGENSRGLGCVNDEGNTPVPADGGNLPHWLDEAEDIGNVAANHGVKARTHQAAESLRHRPGLEEWGGGHGNIRSQDLQGPGNGVMLIAGDHHFPSWPDQAFNSDIQSVGGVECENHLFRVFQPKQLRQLRAALESRVGSPGRSGIASPPRGAHRGQGLPHGGGDGSGLLEAGGRAVEINHASTS